MQRSLRQHCDRNAAYRIHPEFNARQYTIQVLCKGTIYRESNKRNCSSISPSRDTLWGLLAGLAATFCRFRGALPLPKYFELTAGGGALLDEATPRISEGSLIPANSSSTKSSELFPVSSMTFEARGAECGRGGCSKSSLLGSSLNC